MKHDQNLWVPRYHIDAIFTMFFAILAVFYLLTGHSLAGLFSLVLAVIGGYLWHRGRRKFLEAAQRVMRNDL